MQITDEQLNEIGKQADTLDNLIAAPVLPLSAEKKLLYTLNSLRDISAKIKEVFAAVSGSNPWVE